MLQSRRLLKSDAADCAETRGHFYSVYLDSNKRNLHIINLYRAQAALIGIVLAFLQIQAF